MQPSSDPHLNFSMDLSWFSSSPPGTGSSPPICLLLWKYCPSSPCILRRGGELGKKAWTADILKSLWASPEGEALDSVQSALGETEAQGGPALRSPNTGLEAQIVTSFY